MARAPRDHAAEYARRVERATSLGYSGEWARGRPQVGEIPASLIRQVEHARDVYFPQPVQQPDGTFEQPIVWHDAKGRAHTDYLPLGADATDLVRVLDLDRTGLGGLDQPLPDIPEPEETP